MFNIYNSSRIAIYYIYKFFIEGDVNNRKGIINLDQIIGDVSNQINQLPDDASSNEQPSLKEIWEELQEAMESDEEISEEEKEEILQAVYRLTIGYKESNPNQKTHKMIQRAKNNLRDISDSLSDHSKCKELINLI